MRRLIPCVITTAVLAISSSVAWGAQSDEQIGTSTASNIVPSQGNLTNELAGLKPEIGIVGFHDSDGLNTTRGSIGLHYDMNVANLVAGGYSRFYLGPSFGALYSHIGAAGASWFGSSPSVNNGTAGGNLVQFPLEAKMGYDVLDNMRLSVHGGGNVMYRSIAGEMSIDQFTGPNSRWTIYPAVGGDVEFGITKNVALDIRPDVTLTPLNTVLNATVGVGIALG
jgi:hypothetical protein